MSENKVLDGRPLPLAQAAPPNPPLIIIDTDVLVQLLLANEFRPLRDLKRLYKIQPAIVEAVEMETRTPGRSLRRHMASLEPRLQKALGNGTLLLLDGRSLPAVVGAGAHAVDTEISITGTRYHNVADYGEAYSHAAAAILNVPLVSQDMTAIHALERAGERISTHVFRTFDLYAFSHQCGTLSHADCDGVRQTLHSCQEWLPEAFLHRSFEDGLSLFYPRLLDRDLGPVGSAVQLELYDRRLLVSKLSPVSGAPRQP